MADRNEEKELVRRLRKGEYEAYRTLYKLYYLRFLKFATSLLGDSVTAKDIVQEVFIKVWLNRTKLNEEQSIFNYLFVLTKREVINVLRTRRTAELLDGVEAVSDLGTEADVHSHEAEMIVRDKVERMPRQRKAVFTMSRYRGMSNKEISQELGISEKTVERHISLALSDLRKNLS